MDKFIYLKGAGDRLKMEGEHTAFFGTRAAGRGIYAEWEWDNQKLTVTNDRYGFYPLYYACGENSFAVSPSIDKLLQLGFPTAIDDQALAVFLRLGWFIGEDTAFKAVRALPPNATLVWKDGEFEISTKAIPAPMISNISRLEAIQTYAQLFQKAVEKTLPNDQVKTVVPLSGGRDSRHILLALNKIARNPEACVTVLHPPPRPNEDARVAAEICRAVGMDHILVDQSRSRFANEVRKNKLTGYTVFEHGWFLALAEFVKDRWNTVYDGIAGDVLSAGLFMTKARLDHFNAGRFKPLADHLLEPEGYLPSILKKDQYKRFSRAKAVDHLTKELGLHSDAPNPIGSFFFWNRTRRCIAVSPFRLFGDSVRIIAPYLEDDLYEFLSSLPAEMFLDHQFHTETISFAYPSFADIGYEKKNSDEIADHNYFKKYSLDLMRYSLTGRSMALTDRRFFVSRCLRGILDSGYSRNAIDFGEMAVFLMQIERL